MNNVIIGTAGHVDHGKTCLIEALTGIDTDRLTEEKKRGITIDLGYAYIDLPQNGRIGVVDVPGHEKFVRNMLAGAGGISIALLVVAADELFMPQTREHLDILRLLGISEGVVALTKIDKIPDDLRKMTICALKDELDKTVLKDAPIVSVSSKNGEGIEELRCRLDDAVSNYVNQHREIVDLPFFMPIDRSFTIKGFGTVVTGSVFAGEINLSDKYMLYPQSRTVGIRNIQVHSKDCDNAVKGQRCAVNIKDIKKEQIKRGDVLALCDSLVPTMMLDVKLSLLEEAVFEVKNESLVHFYYGSGEYLAKVVLMDRDLLKANDSCYAQLRFKQELVAREQDRFVIRFLSPTVTIGGGVILDSNPIKRKRNKAASLESFRLNENAADKDKLYNKICENYSILRPINSFGSIQRKLIEELIDDKKILILNNKVITTQRVDKLWSYTEGLLTSYHKLNPELPGIGAAELKVRLLGDKYIKDAGALLDYWKENEKIKEAGLCISLYNFKLIVDQCDEDIEKRIMKIYNEAGLNPPAYNDIRPTFLGNPRFLKVLNRLIGEKRLVKLDNRYIITYQAYEEALKRLRLMVEHTPGGDIILGEYRTRIKSSRKLALAVLEYFDAQRITYMEEGSEIRHLM